MNKGFLNQSEKELKMNKYMEYYYRTIGYDDVIWNGDKKKDVTLLDGNRRITVEHKYRYIEYDDILIEIMQDIKTNNTGWFYMTEADFLHYIICIEDVPKYFYRIKVREFKKWCREYIEKNSNNLCWKVSSRGFGITLNMVIKIKVIPENICKRWEIVE